MTWRQRILAKIDDIEKFCEFVNIEQKTFFEIIETFRNKDIWYNDNGVWKIRDFLIPDFDW